MCSTALSTVGSGKRHYKNVHLGEKLPSQMGAGGPDDSGGEGFAAGVSQPTHSMVRNLTVYLIMLFSTPPPALSEGNSISRIAFHFQRDNMTFLIALDDT